MIEQVTAYIQPIIEQYGVWGVFLATLLEEIIAPIPSPLVPLTAGFFLLSESDSVVAIIGQTVFIIALPIAFGVVIGSLVVYGLGYWGGKPMIEKTKRWLGLDWRDIEKMEQKIIHGRGDEITLLFLRALPVVPGVAISGFCGIVRYPVHTFVIVTFVGAFVRAAMLGMTGWYVGVMYVAYITLISKIEKYVLAGILFFSVCLFLRLIFLKKYAKEEAS